MLVSPTRLEWQPEFYTSPVNSRGGDLEGEEEEAGAAGVDLVVGETLDDLIEGELEFVVVGWCGDGEGAAAVACSGWRVAWRAGSWK